MIVDLDSVPFPTASDVPDVTRQMTHPRKQPYQWRRAVMFTMKVVKR